MQEDHAVCSDDVSAEQNPEGVRAPRHGLNAKALLLQAAAQAAQEAAEIEEHAPDTISAQDQEIAKLKAAFAASGKLLTGVPKRETPIVAFVNTTKIPRATRQQVLQKLAGQHLTMALMDAACELIPDQVAARDDLRKVALQAAIDQELKLFKSCMSKASYLNAAARTDASIVKFPPASMQPHSQPNAFISAQQAAALVALNSKETGTSQAGSMPAKAIDTEAAETAPNKRRKLDSKPAPAAIATPLIDDDIDWAASSRACEHPLADGDATDAQHQQDLTLPQQESEQLRASETVQEAAAEDVAEAEAASEACQTRNLVADNQAGSQGNSDKGLVQHAVAEYVRALLDPFYKAGIVDREESEQIQKLVREYIRYAQKKLHK